MSGPLSPLFQPGGVLAFIPSEDVGFTLIFIFLLFLIDILLVKRFLAVKSRYFALHACANTVSTIAASFDLYKSLCDPLHAFQGPSFTMVANSAVASIHFYHILAFKLNSADIFHHVTFVSVLCGLAIPFKHSGGAANNLGCFFLSGLPGGMDYVLLVLVREGKMAVKTEKKWNARINNWLRGPSMVMYAVFGYLAVLYGNYDVPLVILLICVALHFHNGMYYGSMAVQNYGEYIAKERIEKEQLKAK
jgi:hypothetical protein